MMDQQRDKITTDYLAKLTQLTIKVIVTKRRANELQYIPQAVPFIEIEGFAYGKKGPSYTGSSHSMHLKKNWGKAVIDVGTIVFNLPEFQVAEQLITIHYTCPNVKSLLEQYCYQLFHIILESPQGINMTEVGNHQQKLIVSLNGRPHPGHATAYLNGIIVESPEVVITPNVLVRQTNSADLEVKNRFNDDVSFISFPTAVLEVRHEVTNEDYGIFQQTISNYVLLLRLFKTGSVNKEFHRVKFDTVQAPHGMSSGNLPTLSVWHTYTLKKGDENFFIEFLNKLKFSYPKKPNHLSTAFDRYSESLLENVAIERRVANAIMGIEALLSKDNAELTFRLSNRAAKLLACADIDPLQTRTDLIAAYKIRSKYAHGGFIDPQQRKTGNYDNFAVTIINYLRMILIVFIQTDLSKDELLELLDDSMIAVKKSEELTLKITPIAEFLNTDLSN